MMCVMVGSEEYTIVTSSNAWVIHSRGGNDSR